MADLMAEVQGGATWQWFDQRLAGLPPTASWPLWRSRRPKPAIGGRAVAAAFKSI